MLRIDSKDEVRSAIAEARRQGRAVALVPTMGALHEGHLSLVEAACARGGLVVVSIFVNPTQFLPGEDFEKYPRRIETDLELLGASGVEFVFTPSAEEMYGADAQVTVSPGPLAQRWEGAMRPGHFDGVATVVTKLLCIVRPDFAFFGEKDYQQLQIVRHMNRDLDLGVEVVGCPTVRDADGLALSSRNAYLSAEERQTALALPHALEAAALALVGGERDVHALEAVMLAVALGHPDLVLDYAAVVDAATLEPLSQVDRPARAIIAGRVGATHLIDNLALDPRAEAAKEPGL
ncbi:MAG: pantoate--beta-alanine ligase [Coriobacteriia bacterium]|nr:pantoate--beta-alanine ligase [Coriobacteriia bacterium]